MRILFLWFAATVVLATQAVRTLAMFPPDQPGVKRFKDLLAAPPIIQQMVYAQALPDAGRVAVGLERGLVNPTRQEYYELSWQTNGMLHLQLESPSQAGSSVIGGSCFAVWDDQFYFLDARTRPSVYVLERAKAARGVYPDPYHAAHIRMTLAAVPANLGLHHLHPGSIQWAHNQFETVTMADKKPMWVQGQISAISNGIPVELRVHYSNDMGVASYRIAYRYQPYRDPGYPTQIDTFLLRGDKEIPYERYSILSVTTSPAALGSTHYGPERFFPKRDWPVLYLTNNAVYRRLPSGGMLEIPVAMTSLQLGNDDYYRNRYYYAAAAAWTVLILVLGFRTMSRKTQPCNE